MIGATAIVTNLVKKQPVPKEYLIFDLGTHRSRLLERVSLKMRLEKRALEGSGKGQVNSPGSQSRCLHFCCKELMLCPSGRPKDLTCQRVPAHLLPGLVRDLHLTSSLPPSGRKSPQLKREQVETDQTTESVRFPGNKQPIPFSFSFNT